MAAAAKIALGHEQDSSDGSPGRSAGSTSSSSEVLQPSSSRAGQFDIDVSTRSHGSSISLQLRTNPRMGVSLRRRYLGGKRKSRFALFEIRCRPYWLDILTSWMAGGLAGFSDHESYFEKTLARGLNGDAKGGEARVLSSRRILALCDEIFFGY